MTDKLKSPYLATKLQVSKPLNMKEWAIKQLKKGSSPNKIARDIHRLFNEYVSMQTVYRWRNRYIKVTGEAIPGWYEINKSVQQKLNNQAPKWQTKKVINE